MMITVDDGVKTYLVDESESVYRTVEPMAAVEVRQDGRIRPAKDSPVKVRPMTASEYARFLHLTLDQTRLIEPNEWIV